MDDAFPGPMAASGHADHYGDGKTDCAPVFSLKLPLLRQDIDRKLYSAYENNRSIHYWFTDCHCMGAGGSRKWYRVVA